MLMAMAVGIAAMTSCEMFDVHPFDGKIDIGKNRNVTSVARIEAALKGRKAICFAVISDTQMWYDELEDAVASINGHPEVDFVIHCGDIANYGITKEFEWQVERLDRLKAPYVTVIGNHDCIGSGKEVYRRVFGKENYSFVAGDTRFICIDTNELEYDFVNPVPDLKFLEQWAGDTQSKNTVVAMHAAPFTDEFNDNVTSSFEYRISNLNNVQFCLCGHEHKTRATDIFGDGIIYYQITCGEGRQYYIFKIGEDGYECETIDY